MASNIYFDLKHPSGFSTLKRLHASARGRTAGELTGTGCLHFTSPRSTFPRNPYILNNIMDVGECILFDVQGLSKHKDAINYLVNVIDIFFKIPSFRVPEIEDGTQSRHCHPKYSKPIRRRAVWVQTDWGKDSRTDRFRNS